MATSFANIVATNALLESELFGSGKGAFTGAVQDKPGMFRLAEGGALLLTEVGDRHLPLQVKLLSVLDEPPYQGGGYPGMGPHLAWRKLKTHGLVSPPVPSITKEEA